MFEWMTLELIASFAIIVIGALVQGAIGFGLAVVAAPLLYYTNPSLLPGPLIFASGVLGFLSAKRYFKALDRSILGFAIAGRIPGAIVGVMLLSVSTGPMLGLLLGSMVLLAVAMSLSPYKLKTTPIVLFGAGFCSGVMGTSVSIGGPPMALLLQNESGDRIRANLSLFFVFGSSVSLTVLNLNGMFGWAEVQQGLILIPAILLGHHLANNIADKVEPHRIRQVLLVICSISGISAILSAIS